MIDLKLEMRRLLAQRMASVIEETQELEKELLRKQVDDATVMRMSTVTAKLEIMYEIISEGLTQPEVKDGRRETDPGNTQR
jgi:hypothetical protein